MKDILDFKNRHQEREEIKNFLTNENKLLIIQGEKSIGKSRLVYEVLSDWESHESNKGSKRIFTIECSGTNNFHEDVKTYLKVDSKLGETFKHAQTITNLIKPILLFATGFEWIIVKITLAFFSMIKLRECTDGFYVITKRISRLSQNNCVVVFFDNLEIANSDYINSFILFVKRTSNYIKVITTMSSLEYKGIHVYNRNELNNPKNKVIIEKLEINYVKEIINEFNKHNCCQISIDDGIDLKQLSEVCAKNIKFEEYLDIKSIKTIKLILALYNEPCHKEFIFSVFCELLAITDVRNNIKKVDKTIRRELTNNFDRTINGLVLEKSIILQKNKITLCNDAKNKISLNHNSMISKYIYYALYAIKENSRWKHTKTNKTKIFLLKILSHKATLKECHQQINRLIKRKDIKSLQTIFNALMTSNKLKLLNKEVRKVSIDEMYKCGHYEVMKKLLDTSDESFLNNYLFEYRYYNVVYYNYILEKSVAADFIGKIMTMKTLTYDQKLTSFNMKINVYREVPEKHILSNLSAEYNKTLRKIKHSHSITKAECKILRQSIDFMGYKQSLHLLQKAKTIKRVDRFEYMNVINCLCLTSLRLMKKKKELTSISCKLKSICRFAHKNKMHEEPYFLNNLSLVYLMQKKFKKGLKCLEKAITANSSYYADFAIIINSIIARVNLNHNDTMIDEYMNYINNKLKKLKYKDPTILRKIYTNFAYVYMHRNDKSSFIKYVKLARVYSKETTSDKKLDMMIKSEAEINNQLTYQNITVFDTWYIVNSHD